jgi:multidrug efflux pump subunit AcrA (membrane-fusion protein)
MLLILEVEEALKSMRMKRANRPSRAIAQGALFSKIHEVAVAQGELIASVQVRPVRSLGGGDIRKIYLDLLN